jgi:hypothetical protein
LLLEYMIAAEKRESDEASHQESTVSNIETVLFNWTLDNARCHHSQRHFSFGIGNGNGIGIGRQKGSR